MIRLLALLILSASPAGAHGTLPGGGGFAAGMAHPFLAGDHLLLLIGLGGFLGRKGTRRPLAALLAGLIGGYGLTMLQPGPMQPAILVLALAIGGLLAAARDVSALTAIGMAAIAGVLIGADTDGPSGPAAVIAYAGVTAAVFVTVLNAMALTAGCMGKLDGVPLRIAGSWIAAAAILVLAFLARGALGAA